MYSFETNKIQFNSQFDRTTQVSRKYISRETQAGSTDAPDGAEKVIHFESAPADGPESNPYRPEQDADGSISSLTKQIVDQKARIQAISKKQHDFEEEIRMLQGRQPVNVTRSDRTEFENLGNEFQSNRIIKGITSIVDEEMRSRISNIEKQLDYEKRHSETFSMNVEENLKKFLAVEKNLKTTNIRLEEEIKETTEKLIRAERLSAMGELASRLAHDLRNPLTAIKGTIQILKHTSGQSLDDLGRRRIDLIEKSIFRMTHQIESVLDFVRQTPLKRKSASLNEIIISAIQTLMVPSNVSIIFPKDDAVIVCDSDKMQIVFANIILNSIQAIEGRNGEIVIDTSVQDGKILITIKDTGPGIDPSILGKIFEPLFTTKQEGTGLGLSSVKNIVEQHDGKISVGVNPTTFSILLPLQQAP